MNGRTLFISLLLTLSGLAGQESRKPLTLEVLYHPEQKVNFNGVCPPRLDWMKDGRHYLRWNEEGSVLLEKVEAASGQARPWLDASRLEAALEALPGFTSAEARRAVREGKLAVSPTEEALLLEYSHDLFFYDLQEGTARRLTHSPEEEREAEFSPDGRLVAFVRENDLYLVSTREGREVRLTRDGSREVLHGILDWVYQEEIYGRGNFRGFWWSPDSRRLAYLQLIETGVPETTVVHHRGVHPRLEVLPYPKAGDPNPRARLAVYSLAESRHRWIDLSAYDPTDLLLVQVGWKPDGSRIVFQVQNREQTWLDLNLADPESGQVQHLLRETTPAWVNLLDPPWWLQDGGFLWQSERTGWRHLYRYGPGGELQKSLTEGEWEVRSLEGVDEEEGWIYLTATRDSPVETHLYRVGLDGGSWQRLSQTPGWHSPRFNRQASLYIDVWSDLHTPPQVSLHRADGSRVRTLEANPVPALEEYQLSSPEFLQVPARDGFLLEALLIRPPDFDPSRRYPVLAYVYGGPHAPRVQHQWGRETYLWHQYLAQQGYLIWICDNRSASGKGARSVWPVSHHFGESELRDIEDGLDWLAAQPYVDSSRIGIWGWSFGGYLTAYALTHSSRFKVGIAGAPVTDWHLYDSIYTERYMGRPQRNPEGYRKSSVLEAAPRLQGKLLLIHGTIDENVHLQNTLRLVHELQKADKPFELMLYPETRHAVSDPKLLYHVRRLMTRFLLENL